LIICTCSENKVSRYFYLASKKKKPSPTKLGMVIEDLEKVLAPVKHLGV